MDGLSLTLNRGSQFADASVVFDADAAKSHMSKSFGLAEALLLGSLILPAPLSFTQIKGAVTNQRSDFLRLHL